MNISLDEEIRCGYTVTTKLKKIWSIELNLLCELLEVCKKYNLRVTLFGGSMLGAVRHQGFIPWDDDLDVALPREDFDILCRVAQEEFSEPLFFQTALTDRKFFFEFARLRNSETTGLITWNVSEEYNNGIYIDIYPLDGYTSNVIKLRKQIIDKKLCKQFLATYNADETYKSKKPVWVTKTIKKLAHIKPYEYWYNRFNKILKRYNDSAEKISIITHHYDAIRRYCCEAKAFDNILWIPFEGIKVPVLQSYDSVLTSMFGDYMKFPPVEERGAWHQNSIVFEPDIPYSEFLKTYGGSKC